MLLHTSFDPKDAWKLKVPEDTVRSISKKTKAKLVACVKSYSELFPEEYALVVEQIRHKQWLLDDMAFGKTKEDSVIYQALYEIPESLDAIIIQYLSVDELKELRGTRGGRWFAKNFPQFRTPKEV